MRVLLIEDDALTARSLELALAQRGFICDKANFGKDGIEIAKLYNYNVIILDLMLPDVDGYEVLLRLRSARVKVPIIILSGLSASDQKIKGLDLGADDYITKPFQIDELLSRIHAIVRRSQGHAQSAITVGNLSINFESRSVEVNGNPVFLTDKEFYILELLITRRETVLSKEMFLNHLYGNFDSPGIKIIDVFVCKLRSKLAKASGGRNYIETVWGRGYIFKGDDEDSSDDSNSEEQKQEAISS